MHHDHSCNWWWFSNWCRHHECAEHFVWLQASASRSLNQSFAGEDTIAAFHPQTRPTISDERQLRSLLQQEQVLPEIKYLDLAVAHCMCMLSLLMCHNVTPS